MDNIDTTTCVHVTVCKQIEKKIIWYMRFQDWNRCKCDVWCFWRTFCAFSLCQNETAVLEDLYDAKMSAFNKTQVSKKEFVSYMTWKR